MAVRAQARFMLISPYKVRRYLELIRNKPLAEALGILGALNSPTAARVRKLLESASANAENNHDLEAEDLYVSRAFADEGVTVARWRARARGRGVKIRKRTSHITVELESVEGSEAE